MTNYITIDGGTTNTRISLYSKSQVIETLTYNIGAKKSIDNKAILTETIKNGIFEILKKNNFKESDIAVILVCGMLTCEFGLLELPHICAPAGIQELHDNIYKCYIKEITDIPFAFIRGVKSDCTALTNSDMMRGEETELMGVFKGDGIYIFPGSHTKIILTADGKISDFKTMLTGEMISAIAKDTILRDAVKLKDFEILKEPLINGFELADKVGISEALFKVRILKNIFHKTECEIYSFYLGIMVYNEVKYIISQAPKKTVIGGKAAIKEAIGILLAEYTKTELVILSNSEVENSTIYGMIKIYENKTQEEAKNI